MPDSQLTPRQYAGLAFLLVAFIGGIIGWSWAALAVDSEPSAPDSAQTRIGGPSAAVSEGTDNEPLPLGRRSLRSSEVSPPAIEVLPASASIDQ